MTMPEVHDVSFLGSMVGIVDWQPIPCMTVNNEHLTNMQLTIMKIQILINSFLYPNVDFISLFF